MKRATPIREVLAALEWARIERMRTGSPDFVRARVIEDSVRRLAARLIHPDAADAKKKQTQRS